MGDRHIVVADLNVRNGISAADVIEEQGVALDVRRAVMRMRRDF